MASCPKCGKPKLRKPRGQNRTCRHCGILPGPAQTDRSGATHRSDHIGYANGYQDTKDGVFDK